MKKGFKAVICITVLGLLSGLLSGCSSIRKLFAGNVKDGDGMVNYNGYFVEMYNGDWTGADGRYGITVDGYQLSLFVDGEQVLATEFNLYADSDDTDAHNDIELVENEIVPASGKSMAIVDKLYSEKGMLYMLLTFADGTKNTVTFEKAGEKPEVLDGCHTYVDNDVLMPAIAGTWTSADRRYTVLLDEDYGLTFWLDGESVLECSYIFSYLLPREPGEDDDTELSVDAYELAHSDGTVFGRMNSLFYDEGDTADRLMLEISDTGGVSETVELLHSDAANEQTETSAQQRFGEVRLAEIAADGSMIYLAINEVLWVSPDDTELIEQYGLPAELDGYDYEIVDKDGSEEYVTVIGMKDGSTAYALLDKDLGPVPATWQEFSDKLTENGSDLFVTFETEDAGDAYERLTSISQFYIP